MGAAVGKTIAKDGLEEVAEVSASSAARGELMGAKNTMRGSTLGSKGTTPARGMMDKGSDLREPLIQPNEAYPTPEIPKSNIRSSNGPTPDVFEDVGDEGYATPEEEDDGYATPKEEDDGYASPNENFPDDEEPYDGFKEMKTQMGAPGRGKGFIHRITGTPGANLLEAHVGSKLPDSSAGDFGRAVIRQFGKDTMNVGDSVVAKATRAKPKPRITNLSDVHGGKGPIHHTTALLDPTGQGGVDVADIAGEVAGKSRDVAGAGGAIIKKVAIAGGIAAGLGVGSAVVVTKGGTQLVNKASNFLGGKN